MYGLILAQGLIISGAAKNVLLVAAETYSKYIHIQDRSSRVLFGDGAAVSWIAASDSSICSSDNEVRQLSSKVSSFPVHAAA